MKISQDFPVSKRSTISRWKGALIAAVAALAFNPLVGQGQIVISDFDQAVTENFDSMGTGATATLPAHWRVDRFQSSTPYPVRQLGTYAGAGTSTTRRDGNNMTANNAGIFNYGAGPADEAVDRALGFYSNTNATTGTQSGNIYAQFRNDTGQSLSSVALAWDVEKYRNGTNAAGYRFELSYSFDGVNWTYAGDDFRTYFGPDDDGNGYASAPGVVVPVAGVLTFNTPVADGATFYLAWNYSVASGEGVSNSQGLAIDNFSLKAIPEPSSLAALALGLLALAAFGKRRV